MYRNKKATFCEEYRFFKWYLQESNRGHTDFQSDALPTELRHLAYLRVQRYVLLLKLPNVRQLFYQIAKSFRAFSVVVRATSSVVVSYISDSLSMICGMYALSFRLPRWGTGVR